MYIRACESAACFVHGSDACDVYNNQLYTKVKPTSICFSCMSLSQDPFSRDVRHLYISDVPDVPYVPDGLFSV